jgi:hypothetical protein
VDDADFAKLKPGRIVRASVLDMSNRPCGPHPVVVLTSPAENDPDAEFRVACGSRNDPDPGNEQFAIRVAGVPGPLGHPRTGLYANTWFYACWLRTVTIADVDRLFKFFPEHDFLRLRQLIQQAGEIV